MRKILLASVTFLVFLWSTGVVPTFSHVAHDHDDEGPHDHCVGCVVAGSPGLTPSGPGDVLAANDQIPHVASVQTILHARTDNLTPPGRGPPPPF